MTWLVVAAVFVPGTKYRTTNFEVEAPTAKAARQIGLQAERYRRWLALVWLGRELPPWEQRCPIEVKDGPALGGASSFSFQNNQCLSREMMVEGPERHVAGGTLAGQVMHALLADSFGQPVPRWADEGLAAVVDSASKERLLKQAPTCLKEGRTIPFRQLFTMNMYPRDVMAFFVQSGSVTDFLIAAEGQRTFLAFVERGMWQGWDAATRRYYGYNNVDALEAAWKQSQQPPAKREADMAGPSPASVPE